MILWAFQVSRPKPWNHKRVPVPHVLCACVCACIHKETHVHSYPSKKDRENKTIPLSFLISIIMSHSSKCALHRLAEARHPCPPTLMNKLRMHERKCTPWGECVWKDVNWCQKQLYSLHTCTCTFAKETCLAHATLTTKNTHRPAQARLCHGAAATP